ncbi:MAG: hypothetical protein K6D02_00715 [Lachnospiraceae bacterium]|nr:hypothetical protein [Lachnospiraceae bacterium]
MAGTMTHLAIGMRLLEKFEASPELIDRGKKGLVLREGRYKLKYKFKNDFLKNDNKKASFIFGGEAPDAIMSRRGYKRSMKHHTHFRDGIEDAHFHEPENLKIFQKRLVAFTKSHRSQDKEIDEMYFGYLVHMITDELYMLNIRPYFMEQVGKDGLTQFEPETFVRFTYDVDAIDFNLVKTTGYKDVLIKYLKLVELDKIDEYVGTSVKTLISKEEMEITREWTLRTYLEMDHGEMTPKYLSFELMDRFIEDATDEICKRLGFI